MSEEINSQPSKKRDSLMSEETKPDRRRFLAAAGLTLAATHIGIFGSADGQPRKAEPADVPPIKPGTNTSFGPLKQIDAGVLNVGYAEAGPSGGPAVVLLHGWPYDIHSYVDVTPLLASAGYRVIVPYLRGYGMTRFLSSETARNGQQSVLAADIIALMDALKIAKAIVAGYDWGARAANIIAALWPDRWRGTYFFNVLPKIRTKSPVLGLREIEARIQGAGPFLFQLPELSSRLRPTPLGLGMRPSEHSLTAGWSPMRNPKLREVSDGA
jgi:pimeloyl-ACP methyl ester carboxylesterase